jgi:hypothetical protein
MYKERGEKTMTYKEFQTLALVHYNQGGDAVVECWDESDFNDYLAEVGEMTKESALALFEMYRGVRYGY